MHTEIPFTNMWASHRFYCTGTTFSFTVLSQNVIQHGSEHSKPWSTTGRPTQRFTCTPGRAPCVCQRPHPECKSTDMAFTAAASVTAHNVLSLRHVIPPSSQGTVASLIHSMRRLRLTMIIAHHIGCREVERMPVIGDLLERML